MRECVCEALVGPTWETSPKLKKFLKQKQWVILSNIDKTNVIDMHKSPTTTKCHRNFLLIRK